MIKSHHNQAAVLSLILLLVFINCPARGEVSVTAIRARGSISVDGLLSEPIWNRPGSGGFIQRDPTEGTAASERTEVWVVFDDETLYLAARLYESFPDSIMGLLGRRDDKVDSDWFECHLDPYHDSRSGFFFCVNPAGSIRDGTLYNDTGQDPVWDGVWSSAARIDDLGWTVEMAIPFSQLRFPRRDSQVWGINFSRIIKRKNENAHLVMVPKEGSGWVSHFADLTGLNGIGRSRALEILPYAVTSGSRLQG